MTDDVATLLALHGFIQATEDGPGPAVAARVLEGEVLADRLRRLPKPHPPELERAALALLALGAQTGPTWPLRWRALADAYHGLTASFARLGKPGPRGGWPEIKPHSPWRNLFHVHNGLWAFVLYELVFSREAMILIALGALAVFLTLEVWRRLDPGLNARAMQRLRWLVRPADHHRLPSTVWFTLGLLIGTVLLPKTAIEAGGLALALGDPLAMWVGKRWGRHRLRGERTWEGTTAFALISTIAVGALLLYKEPGAPWWWWLGSALSVGVAGALAEAVSAKVDDNLTVPLMAGGVCALWLLVN